MHVIWEIFFNHALIAALIGWLKDVKAELAQQFKEMRGMLDDLGEQTATSAEAKGAGEPVSE